MASSLPLQLHPPQPSPTFQGLNSFSKLNLTPFQLRNTSFRGFKKSLIFASSSSSNLPNWDNEEIRWQREEQRWLREEQRWIREESRWNSERESLLREIADLKLRILALEHENSLQGASISDKIASIASVLQALKDAEPDSAKKNWIPESGSGPAPMLLESEKEEVKEMVVKEVKVLESGNVEQKKEILVKKASLRKGSEGEDVRAMQEALQILGFYSGEEDMEFSSFSSGTERAVKTWQASIDAPEDGIMTAELMERLFMGQGVADAGLKGSNGAVVSSMTEVTEIKQTSVKESDSSEVEVSHHRVFLLGENRWEEPSRLSGRNSTVATTMKCLTCRGEGRLLCSECDGTGELNVEEQFLEWVDEGAKCPYCEGRGYSICDGCEGKTLI